MPETPYIVNRIESLDDLLVLDEPVLVFPSSFNLESYSLRNSKTVTYRSLRNYMFTSDGVYNNLPDKLYYPLGHHHLDFYDNIMLDKLITSICHEENNEKVVIFAVSPQKPRSLSFCLDILDMCYCMRNGISTLDKFHGHYLKERLTPIPYPICSYEGARGRSIRYSRDGDLLSWTNYWHVPPEMIPEGVCKLMAKHYSSEFKKYKSEFPVSRKPFFAENAQAGFKEHADNLIIIDSYKDWPVAFAVKFGYSAIVVVPDAADIPSLVSEMKRLHSQDVKGFNLVKLYMEKRLPVKDTSKPSPAVLHSIELKSLNSVSKIDESISQKFTLKVDGREINVAPKHFLKFIVMCHASFKGNGLVYASLVEKPKLKAPLKRIMMLDRMNMPAPLSGGELFIDSENERAELKQEFKRTVNFNLYGSQDAGKDDNAEIAIDVLQDKTPDGKKSLDLQDVRFSFLKIIARIHIPENIRDDFVKLPITLPGKFKPDSKFLKALVDGLPQQEVRDDLALKLDEAFLEKLSIYSKAKMKSKSVKASAKQ